MDGAAANVTELCRPHASSLPATHCHCALEGHVDDTADDVPTLSVVSHDDPHVENVTLPAVVGDVHAMTACPPEPTRMSEHRVANGDERPAVVPE